MTKKYNVVPITFNKKQEYKNNDTRFVEVEIVLMHLGENLNGSYFSKEVVERALPTLANTPILAYIEENDNGENDFSDHRAEMSRDENGELRFSYKGQAVGLISETNNARFEDRDDGNGNIKTYLIVDGLLWTKWDTPLEIFSNRGVVSQSMELHEDAEGYFDSSDNLYHFDNFTFFGACMLGENVEPAMTGATVSYNFTNTESMRKHISEKMEEFKNVFSKQEERSVVESMSKQVEKTVIEEEVKVILEDSEFAKSDEDKKKEEEEAKAKKSKEADKSDEDKEPKEEKEESEDDKKKKADKSKKKFEDAEELSAEELADSIVAEKDDKVADLVNKASKDEFVDDISEVAKLKKEIESLKEQIAKLKGDVNEYEKVERQKSETELFAKYAELDGIEDYEALKDKASEFACLNDLEKDIALVFVKNKANLSFTKQVETKEEIFESTKINFDNKSEDDGYGGLLNKYLNK